LDISFLKELISCARGEIPSDITILNGTLVNVITRETYLADIAIFKNRIANVAEPGVLNSKNSKKLIDAQGKFISPGFIESHLHIESTMLPPSEFAKLVVPQGTTTVIMDPHEIGNALGEKGLKLLLDLAEKQPLRLLIEIPSCVPAAPGLETTAFTIDDKAVEAMIQNEPRFYGLGEVMNYPGVLFKNDTVLNKVLSGKKLNVIDGHSPGVSGRDLDAYIATGIKSDHESTTGEELLEKLRKGMITMAREGSFAKDLHNVFKLIKDKDLDLRNCTLASDDRNVIDLVTNGHMNSHIRMAVAEGIDILTAIQMVTINAATYLDLHNEIGSIAPGKRADIVLLDNLTDIQVSSVISDGKLVYSNNKILWNFSNNTIPDWAQDTIKLLAPPSADSLRAKIPYINGEYSVKIIGVIPNSLLTDLKQVKLEVRDGWIRPNPRKDVLSISVIERYGVNGNISNAFIQGFKITAERFAMATTVAHDSHNMLVAGTDHETMVEAIKLLQEIKGGYVVIADEKVGKVPLPFGGLMSTQSYQTLFHQLEEINKIFQSGVSNFDEPLMALSFMALPVIPHLKITDKGLVDVDKFAFTELITNTNP
jgi:adenine deaminase